MADTWLDTATGALKDFKQTAGTIAVAASGGAGRDFFLPIPDDGDLGQNKYDFTSRKFPSNLGEQSYNGHYMVININVQNGTRFEKNITTTQIRNNGVTINTGETLNNQLSKTDALRFNIDKKWKDSNGSTFDVSSSLLVPRQTRRIVESIAIYMPNTVVFDTNNDYEDVGLTAIGAGALNIATGFAAGMADALATGLGKSPAAGAAIGNTMQNAAGAIGSAVSTGAKLFQRPINPRVEVLFRNTIQRTFQFDFLFAPDSPEETQSMQQIIKSLRFYSAPEYQNGSGAFLYIPPSEFDITFYDRGVENTWLPRINTCAITKLNVDFAPHGIYSTFTNGAPVSARLQVEFRELEIVSKLRVAQGF